MRSALESLVRQTHDPLEMIVVDNNVDAEWGARVRSVVEPIQPQVPGGILPRLDKKAIRYISMRHWAILAFAEMRRGRRMARMAYSLKSLLAIPGGCASLALGALLHGRNARGSGLS